MHGRNDNGRNDNGRNDNERNDGQGGEGRVGPKTDLARITDIDLPASDILPGSLNDELGYRRRVVTPYRIFVHMQDIYRLMCRLRYFRVWLINKDGDTRSFNLKECMREHRCRKARDPYGRPRLVLMTRQFHHNLNFKYRDSPHTRALSDFNVKHDVDVVRIGQHFWYRNMLHTRRGLYAGEVYRHDSGWRSPSKLQPIRITLYWRNFQSLELDEDTEWIEGLRDRLERERNAFRKAGKKADLHGSKLGFMFEQGTP